LLIISIVTAYSFPRIYLVGRGKNRVCKQTWLMKDLALISRIQRKLKRSKSYQQNSGSAYGFVCFQPFMHYFRLNVVEKNSLIILVRFTYF
jgi:hypothetical protein